MNINYPIISYYDGCLVADNGEGMKVMGAIFPDENTMLMKECSANQDEGWIIEITGKYIEYKPQGKRREWARPLSWLWRFTQTEYRLTKRRNITVGELKELIKNVKDEYEEAPTASSLREHLQNYNDNDIVTEQILREWPI